jgi:serine/threonine-protein kinase
MKPDRWRQIEHLYHAALERAPDGRAAFLDAASTGDRELRREVESLLAYDEPAANFITSPPDAVAAEMLAAEPAPAFIGSSIHQYRILSSLGRGGMGEVYLAEDTRLRRKVAVKLLPSEFMADAERVRRFEQEARAASALNHPNILIIHEIGKAPTKEGGAHYIVSEFVAGETLRALIERGRLGIHQATAIAEQAACALSAAHQAGIIHRDIKPENVMLRPDGLVKVLDFGLAKLTEEEQGDKGRGGQGDNPFVPLSPCPPLHLFSSTTPGMVMGTVSYMSPEQARGLRVDHRTDLFSLGVMLHEMVAGRRPFEGETASDVIAAILRAEPPAIGRMRPDVPTELERIVSRMLEKDREARCQSAAELRADLQRVLRRMEAETGETRAVTTGEQAAEETTGKRPVAATGRERRTRRHVWQATVIGLLIVAAIGYVKYFRASPATTSSEFKSLAVLPLENLSGDPAQEYFADGMTDALIGNLAKIGALRVISRTSAMHYKGARKPLPEIARELNVDVVIEGTVLRSGDRVRIHAQLIQAANDRHLWSETYERDLRDALKLQSEVAQTIAREIQTRITPADQARLTGHREGNREAFDAYLQGRYHRNKGSEAALRTAIAHLQRAIRLDPNYALAYAELARCYNTFSTVLISAQPPLELRRLAEEAAAQALALDGSIVEARLALGHVKNYNWDWRGAEREFKQALELSPNNADVHNHYARFLVANGRAREAIAEIEYAQQLDPLSTDIGTYRGYALLCARRYDEAIRQFQSVLVMDPNYQRAYWHLGQAYAANNQFDEAIRTYETLAALAGRTPSMLGFLGQSYGLAGRRTEANQILNELLELSRRRYVTPPAVASVYMGLGDNDRAFAWLEKAYQERSNYLAYLNVFPGVDSLRPDPRFQELVRRIGLTQ